MTFRITGQHIHEYHRDGFTIFRGLMPASLIADYRVQAEKARKIAHERSGPNAQRLQPVQDHPDVDLKPYRDLCELPALVEAVEKLFGPGFRYGFSDESKTKTLHAILFEPAERPWCTQWHRDWRDNAAGMSLSRWDAKMLDIRMFNQVNAPLYNDSCTWVVPGSHLRRDLPVEIERFPMRPIPGPRLENMTSEEAEIACLDYVTSMPGAFQAHMNAGDFMLYRNSLWHLGNYVPYARRATIHDGVWTDEFLAWFLNMPKREDGKKEMMNPNLDTPEYKAWASKQPTGSLQPA